MKILGISAGRRNGNAEILLREAVAGATDTGDIQAEIVRLRDIDLKQCTGCESCTRDSDDGGKGSCVQLDDLLWLRGRLDECDGLIQAAPTYCLKPCGTYITMVDRFCGFGAEFMLKLCERPKRIAGTIGVGGTDWVQLTLPLMMQAPFLLNMQVVDCMQATWISRPQHVLLRDDLLARARRLGANVAQAMKMPPERVKYMGENADDPAACPYCHQKLLLLGDTNKVSCAICAIEGTLVTKDDRLAVTWSDDSVMAVRWEARGLAAHFSDVRKSHAAYAEGKRVISQRAGRYTNCQASAPAGRREAPGPERA
jgi:multimeric flavodoxin WrbA